MYLRNFHALLVVISALIGNAEVAGYDLMLSVLMAPLCVLTLIYMERIDGLKLFLISLIVVLGIFLHSRVLVLDVPYSEYYNLWPLKTIILTACIALGPRPQWDFINQGIYFVFCIFLIVTGGLVEGRFSSLFGPNMLYRIFGLLYIFGCVGLILHKETRTINHFIFIIVGGYFTLLTGSTAALIIIFLPVFLIMPRLSNGWRVAFSCMAGFLIFLTKENYDKFLNIPVFSRALYKYESYEISYRFEGWSDILNQGFAFGGHSYESLSFVWRFGYSYPHNIFVELYALYGMLGVVIVSMMAWTLIRYKDKSSIFYLAFVTIILGSMLSGDVSDNFGAVTFGLGLLGQQRQNTQLVR